MATAPAVPPRERILRAAETLFAAATFSGAQVDTIAAEAGVNKRLIYHYFGDKAGLYREVLHQAHGRWSAFEYLRDAPKDPLEFIDGFVMWSFNKYLTDPTFVRLVAGENFHEGKYFDITSPSPSTRLLLTTFSEVVQRGRIKGQIREDLDHIQLLTDIMALCFYTVSNAYTMSRTLETDFRAPRFLEDRLAHLRRVIRRAVARTPDAEP